MKINHETHIGNNNNNSTTHFRQSGETMVRRRRSIREVAFGDENDTFQHTEQLEATISADNLRIITTVNGDGNTSRVSCFRHLCEDLVNGIRSMWVSIRGVREDADEDSMLTTELLPHSNQYILPNDVHPSPTPSPSPSRCSNRRNNASEVYRMLDGCINYNYTN